MNKAIMAAAGVVLTGGIIGMSYLGGDEPQQQEVKINAENTQTAAETTISAPTERTVNTSGQYPWQSLFKEVISEAVNSGGQVYLMSDAEPLENAITEFLNGVDKPNDGPYDQTKIAQSWAGELDLFVQDLSEFYPDQKDYFLKLSELSSKLKEGDYAGGKVVLEQAKTLK